MLRKSALAFFLAISLCPPAASQEAPRKRPKIGIAFAGGGARGGAHVGVLKVLEKLRIPVDYIAGTSIGSIVGGLYATGLSPDEMEKILKETDWDAATQDDPSRKEISYRRKEDDRLYLIKAELGFSHGRLVLPFGLLAGQKLGILLRKFTLPFSEERDFDRLPIPYRAVAADLVTGDPVVLSKGDIARCMRASMAIAGLFSPVELDGKFLTDGGAARNLPVDVVRAMGADIVIAIDISTPLNPREKLMNLFAITNQTIGFLTRLNVLRSIETLGPRDVLITPDLEGIGTTDFAQFPLAIPRGVQGAEKAADTLRALSVSEEEYALFLKKQRYPHPTPNVDAVKVQPMPGVDPRVVEARIDYRKKGPVDWNAVDRTLANIYELNDFSTVDFRIVPVDGVSTLIIEPRSKTPAPTRVRFGLLLNTDFSGSSAFGFRFSVNQTRLNALRGEWKTQVELGNSNYLTTQLYQPVDYAGRFFLKPSAGIQRIPFNLFIDETAIGRYLVDDAFVGFDGGISFGPLGQLAAGIRRDWFKYKENISAFPAPGGTINQTAFVTELDFDQLDAVGFPRSGWAGSAQFISAGTALGGDLSFNKLSAIGGWARSRNEWTLLLALSGATKIGKNDLPFIDFAFLGGFLNLSGTHPLQIRGNYSALARVVVYRRLVRLPSLLGTGVYLGGSLESGNAWMTSDQIRWNNVRYAGSLFLGANTLLGPLYFAFGLADRGDHSFYFLLGLPLS
ncbi:MAG: patatin-like phospholipase family protein [Acidithiobacillales bacterium]